MPASTRHAVIVARASRDGDPHGELKLWRDVLALAPAHREGLVNAARCLLAIGEGQQALGYACEAASRYPDDVTSLTWLARALSSVNRNEDALRTWGRVIELSPSAMAHGQAARIAGLLGDLVTALDHRRQVVVLNGDDPSAHVALARDLTRAHHYAEARLVAKSAIDRFPEDARPALALAHLAQAEGARADARRHWESALERDPGNRAASIPLAQALRIEGEWDRALSILETAGSRLSDIDHHLLRARALILIDSGCYDEAICLARRGNDSTLPGTVLEASITGLALHDAGDPVSAEPYLHLACEADPTGENWVALARCRLSAMDLRGAQSANDAWAAIARERRVTAGSTGDAVIRGMSNLIGNRINELLLQPEAAHEARLAVLSGDWERAADVMRRHPGSLAAASALIVTLGLSGYVRARQGSTAPTSPGIPHTIVQAWLGSPLPEDARPLIKAWQQFHPTWEHVLFTTSSATKWLAETHESRVVDAFRRARHPAAKSDLLRLAFLAASGGVWTDIDDRPKRAIDDIVAGPGLVCWHEHVAAIGNNFLAAAPGHPAVVAALDEAVQACLAGYSEPTWLATGPGLMTRAVAGWIAQDPEQAALTTQTIILPQPDFRRMVAPHQPLGYKQGPRSWQRSEQLVQPEQPTDRSGPALPDRRTAAP